MKLLLVVFAALLLCANAQAQLRKCVAPDGKVTYSDVLCNTASTTGSIKSSAGNSLDTSGLRQQAQQNRNAPVERPAARQSAPQDCKFNYFSVGDDKGKRLAEAAKAECLQNNEARQSGQAVSLEHYNFWKDHYSQMSGKRQAAISRENADSNARSTRNAIEDIGNRSYTCKPNALGDALNCK